MDVRFLFENPKLIKPRQEQEDPQQQQQPPPFQEPKSTLDLEELGELEESEEVVSTHENLADPADPVPPPPQQPDPMVEEKEEKKEQDDDSFASEQERVRKLAAKINKTKTSAESKFYSQFVPSSAKRNRREKKV